MKLSPQWIREFVDFAVDYRRLAEDLTSAGLAVEGIRGEGDSTVFEMEIGTNRPDAMNHYGVAREISAIYDLPLKPIEPKLPMTSAAKAGTSRDLNGTTKVVPSRVNIGTPSPIENAAPFPIEIEDGQGCPRFTARVMRDVKVKASPENVARRLALLDQRPINNAVDATNYTLWEIGKPTHVFDLDLLEGGKIIVRRARDGERLKTLDGVERKLTSEDLVVADAKKPVGLAGTMGGFDTMITEKTRNILIESAWWDPLTVRKMSRRHGLHTDASHRFERGADFESTVLSCDRVAELILQSGGGDLVGGVIDVIARRIDLAPVALQLSEVRRILGEELDANEIVRILKRLGFDLIPEPGAEAEFTVQIPSWRLDVEREIDLIEEIARIHGYDKFANTLPAYAGSVVGTPDAEKDTTLRNALLGLGYNEAVSLTFISREDARKFSPAAAIELANPLSEEASVMRTSLVPGMLEMLAYNLNRGSGEARLFEAGNIFEASGAQALERKCICVGATAESLKNGIPQAKKLDVSKGEAASALEIFRSLKGDVETLLANFQHERVEYKAEAADYYHPGRSACAVMDGTVVAQFGQIDPDIASARKLKQDVYVAELYLDRLYKHGLREVRYEPLPRYPAVERDFSFIFDDSIVFQAVSNAVKALDLAELRSFVPVEIFRGGTIPAGKYSLLVRANFQSLERTLREDEVAQWSAQIVKVLEQLGGTQRA
jgi:phenylalanyl-tRNA synthetase beta chain